jgi:hypothetical protein
MDSRISYGDGSRAGGDGLRESAHLRKASEANARKKEYPELD